MFARDNARHHQVAYVTNDLNRAIEMFKAEFGAPGFLVFSNVDAGTQKAGDPKIKIALSRVGGVEIELIEPIADAGVFGDWTAEDEFDVRFHHLAVRIGGPMSNWEAYAASIDTKRHPVVFEGGLGDDLRYFYTDERARLGHYVEHVWMSDRLLAQSAAMTPTFPALDHDRVA